MKTDVHWILTLLVLVSSGVSCDSPTSFQGGYQKVESDPTQNGLFSVHLQFRTLRESGLLFLVNGSNGILALSLDQDQLVLLVEQYHPSPSNTVHRLSVATTYHWRTVDLLVNEVDIRVNVDGAAVYVGMTTSSLMTSSQSIYLGGSENFFSPLYRHLPTPHFFIGCMQDVSITDQPVYLNSSLTGLSAGCCTSPRYPAYCLSETDPSLSFSLPPGSTSGMHLSLRLQFFTAKDSTVLSSSSLSAMWHLRLVSGSLQLTANTSAISETLNCPGNVGGEGVWHHVEIEFTPTSLSCMVNGHSVNISTSIRWEWPRTLLYIGEVQSETEVLHVQGFEGCVQRVRVDKVDVGVELFTERSNLQDMVRFDFVNLTDIQFHISELLVVEHAQEIVTSDIIRVHLPQDSFQDDLSQLYQEELEQIVHFQATAGRYGHLYMGHPSRPVTNFTLYNLMRGVASEQIGYIHTGGDSDTDEVLLGVWVGCDHQRVNLTQLTLTVNIEESEGPRLVSWRDLELAVGTRVPVSPRELLVEDIADPSDILFSVKRVEVQGAQCSNCSPPGVLVNEDGINMALFSQADVNRGLVHFQHYQKFSTALIVVHLSVTSSNKNFNVSFRVQPISAYLRQSSHQRRLYVKMSGMAKVQPRHLYVETSFDSQTPVITYDLVTEPMYGVLQLWIPILHSWTQLHPLNQSQSPLLHSPHSFSQRDIQSGFVRYVRSPSSDSDFSAVLNGVDTTTFQVRSYNLSGPLAVLKIEAVLDTFLFQPSIAISVSPLVLNRENSSAVITSSVLNTSLDSDDYSYLAEDPDYEIDIHQVGIVYHIVESPSYGALELDSVILTAGDNFTWEDLSMRRLVYRHFGTENHQDSFTFYAEASSTAYLPIVAPNLTANLTLSIHITATNNHRPTITLEEPIHPPEGMAVQVTSQNLNVEDADVPSYPITIILRKLKKYTTIGHFVLRSDSTAPVQEFTMEDVHNGSVLFMHWLNASAALESHVGIKVLHQQGDYVKDVVRIAAVPLDLSVRAEVPGNSTCVGRIEAEGFFALHAALFHVTLRDAHGNDLNLISDILVSQTSRGSSLGHLYKTNTTGASVPVSQFQLQDLGSIIYMLDSSSRLATQDTLYLTFSYGHSTPVQVPLQFCVHPVLLPLEVGVAELTMKHGRMEYITEQHIQITSSRPGEDGALRLEVVEQPRNGQLSNSQTDQVIGSQMSFTLEDLRNGSIMYEFSGELPTLNDYLVFKVCAGNFCLGHQVLNITVFPIDISYNTSRVSVREVSSYTFLMTDFNIQAPPRFTSIKLIIGPKKPDYGKLLIRTSIGPVTASYLDLADVRNERLYYDQSVNAEKTMDSFDVRLEAEVNGVLQQNVQFHMRIDIIPVNNRVPELVTTLDDARVVIVWGGSGQITSSHLSAHDYDSHTNDEDLIWSLAFFFPTFSFGYLYLDDPSNKGLLSWTEGDIRNGRLHFKHEGNPNITAFSEILVLDVTDGKYHTPANLIIEIRAVIILQDGSSVLELEEGGSLKINFTHLHFTTENTDVADEDVFIVVGAPSHGNLRLNGSNLTGLTRLTQDVLGMGLLEYIHDGSETLTDSFRVMAQVPHRGPETVEVSVTVRIQPVNDQPPVVTVHSSLYVVELQRVVVSNVTMSIADADARTDQDFDDIKCTLTKRLGRGQLIRRRHQLEQVVQSFSKYDLDNQGLFYRHLDTPHLEPDHLIFRTTDGINSQSEITDLRIIVLPLVVPVTLKPLTVNENEGAYITDEELLVGSPYMESFMGLIELQEGSGPHHGQLVYRRTQAVRSFTTQDIAMRQIYYNHYGDEFRDDTFTFVYTILDPAGFNRTSENLTFYISISPVDDQPPVIHARSSVLRLWARETVPLTTSQFNVSDPDTPPNKLNITVRVTLQDSYVAFSNNTAQFIHWFTLADLLAGKVVLVHKNGPSGNISYTVWDSFYHTSGYVSIIADLLTLDCQTRSWKSIHVRYLASVPVTSDNLHCTTADDNGDREILYSFPRPQIMGHFEVNSQQVNSFNSSTLRAGHVRYVHTQTGYWEESEIVGVDVESHPAEPAHQLPVTVNVLYPQGWETRDVAINHGLHLPEGGSRCLNSSVLDARNWRYLVWSRQLNTTSVTPAQLEVIYNLEAGPSHGLLTKSGNTTGSFTQSDLDAQRVCYTHDNSEDFQETLSMEIQVIFPNGSAIGSRGKVDYSIFISPVNDQKPLLHGKLQKILVDRFDSPLQASDLSLEDGDTRPQQLLIHLHSTPFNVDIVVNGTIVTTGAHFSQRDIDLGLVKLQPHSIGSDHFLFTFTDGAFTSAGNLTFQLQVEGHELLLVTNEAIEYSQNANRVLVSERHLNTSTNGLPSLTIFTLQSGPVYGRLVINNIEVKNFSQQDIYDKKVTYIPHTGTQNSSDTFTLAISNHQLSLENIRMNVHVLVWGEVSSMTTINFNPLATPSPDGRLPAISLPADILVLDELEKANQSPPIIELLSGPWFGHLERHVSGNRRKRFSRKLTSFRYEELEQGWIMYVWDYNDPLPNSTVLDMIRVLVRAERFQPGEAELSLNVTNPMRFITPRATQRPQSPDTLPNTPSTIAPPSEDPKSGFPFYTLVPILGIFCFLVLLIAVIVCCCVCQQNHKLKFAPNSLPSPHQSPPWSASPTLQPGQLMSYDMDPSGGNLPDDHHNNSETSSGFSEPDASFHGSPVQSYTVYQSPSPSVIRQQNPPHSRSRMRSNVSITFSSQHSTTSDISYEDEAEHMRSLYALSSPHYPSSSADPVPTRPSSHTAPFKHNTAAVNPDMVQGRYNYQPPQPSQQHKRAVQDSELDCDFTRLPDIRDHDLNALFHAPNPVLKKEEYWI